MKAQQGQPQVNSATAPSRSHDLWQSVPKELRSLENPQTAIPAIAKDARLMSLIDNAVRSIPTTHHLFLRDARSLGNLKPSSVHLVLTSPPYWTLKQYRDSHAQLQTS